MLSLPGKFVSATTEAIPTGRLHRHLCLQRPRRKHGMAQHSKIKTTSGCHAKVRHIAANSMQVSSRCSGVGQHGGCLSTALQMTLQSYQIRCSIVVSISACHAEDQGSIPGGGVFKLGGGVTTARRKMHGGRCRQDAAQTKAAKRAESTHPSRTS